MVKNRILLISVFAILFVAIMIFLRFKSSMVGNNHDGSYIEVLELAIKSKDYTVCYEITERPFYGDYFGTVTENIEICKAEYSVVTNDLELCLSINSYIRNNVCLPKIADIRKDAGICESVYIGGEDNYIETRISTCITRSKEKN